MQGSTFLCTFAPDLQTIKHFYIMTAEEKQVLLSFYREQQRYNEALASFLQLVLNIDNDPSPI